MQDEFRTKVEKLQVRLRGLAGGVDYQARVAQDALEVISIQQTVIDEYKRLYESESFGDVFIGAVRYGLGRKTYYPLNLLQALKPIVPRMTTNTLSMIVDEICRNLSVIADDEVTAEYWQQLLTDCREELMKRI